MVFGVNFDYGYLLKHTESLRGIGDNYPFGIELDWSRLLITEKSWNFCNCFPRLGVSLAYWNFDNPDVLGSGLLALAYAEPYFNTRKRTNIFFRMGMGAAYLSNPYDEVSNPQNLSYSTDLSFYLLVGAGLNYRLDEQWSLRLAVKYNHTSNGGVSTPNKGLNFPSLSTGVNYSLHPVNFPAPGKKGKRPPPENKNRWTLVFFSGWSNAAVGDKDKFYVGGLLGSYSRWIAARSALNIGTEWVFDLSRQEKIKVANSSAAYVTAAVLLGHEFWLGKVVFSQKLGIYYFNQFRDTPGVYQRYGLTYDFTPHFFGGFNLKAHGHVADFFDFRLGYRF